MSYDQRISILIYLCLFVFVYILPFYEMINITTVSDLFSFGENKRKYMLHGDSTTSTNCVCHP